MLDPWQRLVLDDSLAESDGLWSAAHVDLIVPRQNGKNGTIEARELYGLGVMGESFLHTAHLFKTTRESFERLEAYVERGPLREILTRKTGSHTTGYEMRFSTGGRIEFIARSKSSGRGKTADVLVLDEAQDLDDDALGALVPTLSARPNAQTWSIGSAPGPHSLVWHRRRTQGRSGQRGRFAFFEWSAEPDASLDDREAWAQANPALGIRITDAAIESERAQLSDEMFARERLGISPDLIDEESTVFEMDDWLSCGDSSSTVDPLAWGVAAAPDQSWACIAVAGFRADGRAHLEVIDYRPKTKWLGPRLAELTAKWGTLPVVVWGPVGSGRDGTVTEPSPSEMSSWCSLLLDRVEGRQIRHIGQKELDVSVRHATIRARGDSWMWAPRKASVDISPLVAVTLAMGAMTAPVPPKAEFFVY